MAKTHRKILIVDDNPVIQKAIRTFFAKNGYVVVSAWSGEECLQQVLIEKPDVILMDVILPDTDGKDIARKVRADTASKNIPIVFTTNTLDVAKDKGYESFKIDDTVYRAFAKPPHYPKLLSTIKKEINRSLHGGKLPPKLRGNEEE